MVVLCILKPCINYKALKGECEDTLQNTHCAEAFLLWGNAASFHFFSAFRVCHIRTEGFVLNDVDVVLLSLGVRRFINIEALIHGMVAR